MELLCDGWLVNAAVRGGGELAVARCCVHGAVPASRPSQHLLYKGKIRNFRVERKFKIGGIASARFADPVRARPVAGFQRSAQSAGNAGVNVRTIWNSADARNQCDSSTAWPQSDHAGPIFHSCRLKGRLVKELSCCRYKARNQNIKWKWELAREALRGLGGGCAG